MRRRDLEMALQRIPAHPDPDPALEQVPTPPDVASRLLWTAHGRGDLEGRRVADLGSGTGLLAIGAALLGAAEVVGVEADPAAVERAREAAAEAGVDVEFLVADVEDWAGAADTVVQNPPFGAQDPGADRPFLRAAVAAAPVVYTFHLAETRPFVEDYVRDRGAEVTDRWEVDYPVPRLFDHHEEAERRVPVVLLRLERRDDPGTQ